METLTYDAVSSNMLSAMADIGVRVFWGSIRPGSPIRGYKIGRLSSATTVAQNLFLHLVHFARAGARLIIEAVQM